MKAKIFITTVLILLALVLTMKAGVPEVSAAEAPDCKMCHSDKVEAKNMHPAVMMGCPACHANVDATNIPHNFGGTDKGLIAEPPDLCMFCHDSGMFSGKATVHMPVMAGMCITCHDPHGSDEEKLLKAPKPEVCFECHEKTKFYGPTIHEPVGLGLCPTCHEPHQSDNEKLLKGQVAEICFMCHDSAEFEGTSVHSPVAAGLCTECHLPHASQNSNLLIRKGNLLCRKCHAKVEKTPHAIMGFNTAGHPLRGRKDPMRSGKVFGCLSCHLPHASESPRLFRYKADSMFDLCTYCHNF
jgi:predicted CXXCH cytochrome family protein